MDLSQELRKTFRQAVILCGAMTGSLLVYLAVFEVVQRMSGAFRPVSSFSTSPALKLLFYGAAIGIIILTRLIARGMPKNVKGEEASAFIQKLARLSVVIAALSEVPALLGFFYFFLSADRGAFYVFLFVSLVLEFIYFPRLKVWEEIVRSRFPSVLPEGGSID